MKAALKDYTGPKDLTVDDLIEAGAFVDLDGDINIVTEHGMRVCFANGRTIYYGDMKESIIPLKDVVSYVLPEGTKITLET